MQPSTQGYNTTYANPSQAYSQPQSQPHYQPQQQQQFQTQEQHQPFVNSNNNDDFSGWMDTSTPSSFSGTMDSTVSVTSSAPSYFTPQLTTTGSTSTSTTYTMGIPVDEPPLLEELGINMDHILLKTKAVVVPFARLPFQKDAAGLSSSSFALDAASSSSIIMDDADLAGPLVFALLLGAELLVTGKTHSFGYIYGLSLFGCCSLTLVLNLMRTPHKVDESGATAAASVSNSSISIWTTTSILGYALLPVNLLAAVKILFVVCMLKKVVFVSRFLGVVTVVWSTMASTRLLEVGCDMRHQRYLIAYPIALLYSAFVLLTIF
jgi:hypothetical protein